MTVRKWSKQDLRNELESLSNKMERIRMEFSLRDPDEEACDSLLKETFSSVGDILKQRKERGWPE